MDTPTSPILTFQPVIADILSRRDNLSEAIQKGHLTPSVSRYLAPGWAYLYKDAGGAPGSNPALAFAATGNALEQFSPTDEGSIAYVVTTSDEDRDGDIVRPMGGQLLNYARNPLVFFGHQEWEIPIGVCRSPDGRITVYPEEQRMIDVIHFDRADSDADFIYNKCKRKILNATSIAFVPIEAWRRNDVQKARTHSQGESGAPPGWYFNQWDKTEVSIVGVPSNPKAVGLEKDLMGACRDVLDREKSFMSMKLQKAWQPYCATAKGCWNGWCPLPDGSTRQTSVPGEEKDIGRVVLKAVRKSYLWIDTWRDNPSWHEENVIDELRLFGSPAVARPGLVMVEDTPDGRKKLRQLGLRYTTREPEEKSADGLPVRFTKDLPVKGDTVESVARSADPDPEMDFAENVRKAGEELAASTDPAPMPGYGQIFRGQNNELHYVGGDGDEDGFYDLVLEKLQPLTTAEVTYEAESFPPKDEGWEQMYPEKPMKTKTCSCGDCSAGKACQCGKSVTKQQPSDDIDPEKACKILRDGEVDGKPLTDEQRGMFGAACAKAQKSWGGLRETCKALVKKSHLIGAYKEEGRKTALHDLQSGTTTPLPTTGDEADRKAWQESYDKTKAKLRLSGYWPGDKVSFELGIRTYQATVVPPGTEQGYTKVRIDSVSREGGPLAPGKVTNVQNSSLTKKNLSRGSVSKSAKDDLLAAFDRMGGSNNFVSLEHLRAAVPLGRSAFDQALNDLRREGKLTMSAAEGRHGITPAQRDAALKEGDDLLLYVSRRKSVQADLDSPGVPGRSANPEGKASQEKGKTMKRTATRTKAPLASTDGRIGGYTVPPTQIQVTDGDPLPTSDTTPEGYAACETCHSSGSCDVCGGDGEFGGTDCGECGGSGECGSCAGEGHMDKQVRKSAVQEALTRLARTPHITNAMQVENWAADQWFNQSSASREFSGKGGHKRFAAAVVDEWKQVNQKSATYRKQNSAQLAPQAEDVVDIQPTSKGEDVTTDEEQPSLTTPQVLAALYSHAKAEAAYIDQLDEQYKDALADYRADQLEKRMEQLKDMFGQEYQASLDPPEEALEKLCKEFEGEEEEKGMESTGPDNTMEPGEAGLVEQGQVPPETMKSRSREAIASLRSEPDYREVKRLIGTFTGFSGALQNPNQDRIQKLCERLSAKYPGIYPGEINALARDDVANQKSKGMTSTGPDSTMEPGEVGIVEQGQIPETEDDMSTTKSTRRKSSEKAGTGKYRCTNCGYVAGDKKPDECPDCHETDTFEWATRSKDDEDDIEKAGDPGDEIDAGPTGVFNKAEPGSEEWAEEEAMEPEHKAGDDDEVVIDKEEDEVEEKAPSGICMCGVETPEGVTECPGCGAPVKGEKQIGGNKYDLHWQEDGDGKYWLYSGITRVSGPYSSSEEAIRDRERVAKTPNKDYDQSQDVDIDEEKAEPFAGEETPEEEALENKNSDPAAEEILERYQHPKSAKWATRKWLVNKSLLPFLKHRVAANGKKYLVRAKAESTRFQAIQDGGQWKVIDLNSGQAHGTFKDQAAANQAAQVMNNKAELAPHKSAEPTLDDSEVKALTTKLAGAIDDLKALATAKDLPRQYKACLKHVADQIWYVGKALTDKGKEQKNGGKGSELNDKGKVQANGKGGGELKDKGEQQGKSPSKSYTNGTNGRTVSPVVEQKMNELMDKLRRNGLQV